MKTIPLTKGQVALIDTVDYEAVSQFKWHALETKSGRFYAARSCGGRKSKRYIYMHKFLLPGAKEVNHIDGNGLNNQRYNLQPCTHAQNMQGFQTKYKRASSKFRGVSWDKKARKWESHITVNSRKISLGRFINEEDAARAYDSAAIFYFGEWASTNFPIGDITIT